jgi:hypothetical protein
MSDQLSRVKAARQVVADAMNLLSTPGARERIRAARKELSDVYITVTGLEISDEECRELLGWASLDAALALAHLVDRDAMDAIGGDRS